MYGTIEITLEESEEFSIQIQQNIKENSNKTKIRGRTTD
jgi:hypothetical protein